MTGMQGKVKQEPLTATLIFSITKNNGKDHSKIKIIYEVFDISILLLVLFIQVNNKVRAI